MYMFSLPVSFQVIPFPCAYHFTLPYNWPCSEAPWKLKSEQISVDVSVTDNQFILKYEFVSTNQSLPENVQCSSIHTIRMKLTEWF